MIRFLIRGATTHLDIGNFTNQVSKLVGSGLQQLHSAKPAEIATLAPEKEQKARTEPAVAHFDMSSKGMNPSLFDFIFSSKYLSAKWQLCEAACARAPGSARQAGAGSKLRRTHRQIGVPQIESKLLSHRRPSF